MNIVFKPTEIELDTTKLLQAMSPYIALGASRAEEKFLEFMGIGIDETSTAPHGWRDSVKADLKHIETIITSNSIQYVCGLDYGEGTAAWMKAMVIGYGMGIKGLSGQRIMAGPEGRIVWDGNLDAQIPSKVKYQHEIPQSWYHAGGQFLQNATSKMQTLFADIVEDALSTMPRNIILSCITVKLKG